MRRNRIFDALVLSAAYLAFRIAIPAIKLGSMHPAGRIALISLSVLVLMLAQLAVIVALSRLRPTVIQALLMTLVSGALFVWMLIMPAPAEHGPWAIPLGGIRDLILLTLCSFLGCSISFIIRDPKLLLPVGVVAAAVDFWNIAIGPLGQMVENNPEVVAKAAVSIPTPDPAVGAMMGGGDAVFLALFFAVLFRFSLNAKGTFWLGYALLVVSMLLVVVEVAALPALVPMALAVLLANYKHMNLSHEEWMATIYVLVLVVILLIISGLLISRNRSGRRAHEAGWPYICSTTGAGCFHGRQI